MHLTPRAVARRHAFDPWKDSLALDGIRGLVLDDERLPNHICWSVFDG